MTSLMRHLCNYRNHWNRFSNKFCRFIRKSVAANWRMSYVISNVWGFSLPGFSLPLSLYIYLTISLPRCLHLFFPLAIPMAILSSTRGSHRRDQLPSMETMSHALNCIQKFRVCSEATQSHSRSYKQCAEWRVLAQVRGRKRINL